MARYLCAQCGSPGDIEVGYTQMDPRWAFGFCTGEHKGRQLLVREDQPLARAKAKKEK
jgi:hypothetical protein